MHSSCLDWITIIIFVWDYPFMAATGAECCGQIVDWRQEMFQHLSGVGFSALASR